MKISYDTHPALQKLKNGTLGKSAIPLDGAVAMQRYPDMFYELNNVFKKKAPLLKNSIFHLSNSFYDSAEKAHLKLSELYLDMLRSDKHDFEENKVFVFRDFVICFSNIFSSDNDLFDVFYMVMTKQGVVLEFYYLGNYGEKVCGWSSDLIYSEQSKDSETLNRYLNTRLVNIASMCMFIKYAEVETKTVLGRSKRRFGDPYRNDTDFPITHLDSKWFTNIVRSEGFSVRGHFRLQPKKINGEWTKELIWINDFEKHGYTSKARILNQ